MTRPRWIAFAMVALAIFVTLYFRGHSQSTSSSSADKAKRMQSGKSPPKAASAPFSARDLTKGATIWVNMWNYPEIDADDYCRKLQSYGISNIILQTSRPGTPALVDAPKLAALVDAAHPRNMRVWAWSFAMLQDPAADADLLIAAARFRSPSGNGVDGIVANLENNLEYWRVQRYSQRLRNHLGPYYPMMAAVYSPVCQTKEARRTPWRLLAVQYQYIAPMVYWNTKYSKHNARDYTVGTVRAIRALSKDPRVKLHLIGDGMGTRERSITQFLKACRQMKVHSASLYPNGRLSAVQYKALKQYARLMEASGG